MNRMSRKHIGLIVGMVAALVVSSCGGAGGPKTAEAVHTAWITALASGEQTAAQQRVAG